MRCKKVLLSILAGTCLFLSQTCHHANHQEKKLSIPDQSSTSHKNAEEIIIYGSKTCPHCMAFIQKMDREGIHYSFKEVDNDDENYQEMFDKIKSINFKGYVNYPVVDVGGEILVAPSYDKFYSIYSR